ncbi:MAG TPA: NAD(P)H-dependent oxidoreductase subunit E [Tissierellaceae bacterium]
MIAKEKMEKVDEVLELYGKNQSSIITILQEIQKEFRYLPIDVLEYVSEKMDISPAKLFGIATFYENFSLNPKGKYLIKICDGTACHVKKSIPVLEAIRKELSLTEGKTTTDDLLFTVETVSCLGACGLAPVMNINDTVYGELTPDKAVEIIRHLKEGQGDEN